MKDNKTPLEAALAAVGSLECLELLEKVTYNAAVQPAEEKFRRLKLSNSKIRAQVAEAEGGLAAMGELGWQQGEGEEGEGPVLTLPKGGATMAQVCLPPLLLRVCVCLDSAGVAPALLCGSCVYLGSQQRLPLPALNQPCPVPCLPCLRCLQVRAIQEAQQAFKKNERQVKRSKSAASLPGTQEQQALRQQLEADRLERAAAGPVTKGSTAQPLPGGSGSGPRLATAKDAGIHSGDCC
jgi:hypothetical protein